MGRQAQGPDHSFTGHQEGWPGDCGSQVCFPALAVNPEEEEKRKKEKGCGPQEATGP